VYTFGQSSAASELKHSTKVVIPAQDGDEDEFDENYHYLEADNSVASNSSEESDDGEFLCSTSESEHSESDVEVLHPGVEVSKPTRGRPRVSDTRRLERDWRAAVATTAMERPMHCRKSCLRRCEASNSFLSVTKKNRN